MVDYKIQDYDAFLSEVGKVENAAVELQAQIAQAHKVISELSGVDGLLGTPEKVAPIFESMAKTMQEVVDDLSSTTKHVKDMAGALVDVGGRDASFMLGNE
jgi:hypothetical protein